MDTVAWEASIFGDPAGCVVEGSYIYIADYAYNVIWRILNTSPYTAAVFAGTVGEPGSDEAPAGPATAARFNKPWGLASDGANLYVADSENYAIRKVEIATGIVSTLASGLDGPMGLFYYPGNGLLYCTEAYSGEVSTISLAGTVTTLLANQPSGYEWPTGIVRDASNIYVVDQGVNSIWKIDAAHSIDRDALRGQQLVRWWMDQRDGKRGAVPVPVGTGVPLCG